MGHAGRCQWVTWRYLVSTLLRNNIFLNIYGWVKPIICVVDIIAHDLVRPLSLPHRLDTMPKFRLGAIFIGIARFVLAEKLLHI
jgi:hypothetical protein